MVTVSPPNMSKEPQWEDYPYKFAPKRDLTLEEMNELMLYLFGMKVYPEYFYNNLPDNLKEFFEEREEIAKLKKERKKEND